MIDLVQMQEDLAFKLLSEPSLARVNVLQLRKMVIASQVNFKLLTTTKRNGRLGCGAVVEMPTFSVPRPGAPGPEGLFEFTVLVAEQPTLNMQANSGTLLSAEEAALRIVRMTHKFFLRGYGEFAASRQTWEPAEFEPGHVAYRVRLGFLHTVTPENRVAVPTVSDVEGLVTLACTTADARIYYTLDGSLPGSGNPVAAMYAEPFQVDSGTTLRVAAYHDDYEGSDVDEGTINY